MRTIKLAPRTMEIVHPEDPEIRVKFRVPTRPEAVAIESEIQKYMKTIPVMDPETGKLLKTERRLAMPLPRLVEIMERFVQGVEGVNVENEAGEKAEWKTELFMDRALDYKEEEGVVDADGNPVWLKDEDGKIVRDAEDKPVQKREKVRKSFWQLLLDTYMNPDREADEEERGKDSQPQRIAS